ncbi:MAG: histidinol-phosphate aminotransferase, partial [Deltaproteobacteria bacterium]|nr:histidinol-phosphate aminotransferase [Deltaproteobacteria bacterium]
DGAFASALMNALIHQGIFVRMPGVAPLNRCIRITAGLPWELEIFAETLPQALKEVRKTF